MYYNGSFFYWLAFEIVLTEPEVVFVDLLA